MANCGPKETAVIANPSSVRVAPVVIPTVFAPAGVWAALVSAVRIIEGIIEARDKDSREVWSAVMVGPLAAKFAPIKNIQALSAFVVTVNVWSPVVLPVLPLTASAALDC